MRPAPCCAPPSSGMTSAPRPSAPSIRATLGRERLIRVTGNDALTGFTAPKILWVRRHEPHIYARARHILLPKDFVRYHMTGGYAMDKADGSGTLLFDLAARDWSPEVLGALEIPAEWLPPTFEGPETTGRVTHQIAELTGLTAGTPVVAGGGDQAAQAVGVGAVEPGTVALTLGTSGVVFAPTSEPLVEPEGRLHAFCHALPGRWHLMGVMLAAAGSLQWYRDTLAPGMPFDTLVEEAAEAPAGCEGLALPAVPLGRAHAVPRPAGAWRLHRVDAAPPPRPPDPGRVGGCRLWPARRLRTARRGRPGGRGAGARLGRRHA